MFLPAGYISLYDAPIMLVNMNEDTACVEDFDYNYFKSKYISLLGGEKINAFGWDLNNGNLLDIPSNYWRKVGSTDAIDNKKLIKFENSNKKISPPVLVIIKIQDSKIFNAGYFENKWIPDFNISEWEIDSEQIGNNIPKNLGGRPRENDWEAFFVEVAIYADRENLKQDSTWTHLRNHMKKWVKENWQNQPDESTIKKKLKKVEEAYKG